MVVRETSVIFAIFARCSALAFRRGVVLNVGRTVASYGDDIWALVLSAVWTAQPDSNG
jgi:hypothetical protein